jgi:hypothetical protein
MCVLRDISVFPQNAADRKEDSWNLIAENKPAGKLNSLSLIYSKNLSVIMSRGQEIGARRLAKRIL